MPKGAAFAIGNFDGVHLGHQKVMRACLDEAGLRSIPSAVMSFEPPPSSFFHPQKKQYRLTLPDTKQEMISRLGVGFLLNLDFGAALATMEAEDFVSDILERQLEAKYIVVGENFRFGKKRQGDVEFLKRSGAMDIEVIPSVKLNDEVVSSTNIRTALKDGNPDKARRLLGRWFQLDGTVIKGEQRGRAMGFPTINIALDNYTQLAYGVYAVRVLIKNKWFEGAANIGVRPTLGDLTEPLLEVYLFDADGDFYGEAAQVLLLDFIRPEAEFEGLEQLKKQIADDCLVVKQKLAKIEK